MQGDSANAGYEAELKAVTKKHGFKNFAEYEAVAASISLGDGGDRSADRA